MFKRSIIEQMVQWKNTLQGVDGCTPTASKHGRTDEKAADVW